MDGTDGADAFLLDFLFQYDWFQWQTGNSWSPVFIGFGLGGWMTSSDDNDLEGEDSDVDIIANIGIRFFGTPDTFNTSFFMEARSGMDELGDLSKYGRFGAGLRFRF